MSHRQSIAPQRGLTLTEELEKIEQSITLTLQEIDHNFSRAHRIVTSSILPIVENYGKHSEAVWEGSKFWKQFFEASANVSLSGYEAPDDETTHEETRDTQLYDEEPEDTVTGATATPPRPSSSQAGDLDDTSAFDSPSMAHAHSTPRAPRAPADEVSFSEDYPSPYEALKRKMQEERTGVVEPTTPGVTRTTYLPDMSPIDSSPFKLPVSHKKQAAARDPVLHHMLDKTYRIAATPLTAKKQQKGGFTPGTSQQGGQTIADWDIDSSPPSSPAPQLRADIFSSPIKAPRTPGVSVQRTPAKSAKKPFGTPQTKGKAPVFDSDSEEDEDGMGFSPPKTMQFHIPQSRLLQTPAREARSCGADGGTLVFRHKVVFQAISTAAQLECFCTHYPPISTMPKSRRPPTSGYARIAQAEEEEEEEEDGLYHEDDDFYQNTLSTSQYTPIQPGRDSRMRMPTGDSSPKLRRQSSGRRARSNSGVDIKAINARFERWADEIATKFKIKTSKERPDEEPLEIHHSVFQAPDWIRPATADSLTFDHEEHPDRITTLQFEELVESVRLAIDMDVHPKLISQGSSGSYFARNTQGKVVGVFKPKDEEPYASRNPKWTKWIHRNLFPFFFGRACLIPNLSYVSEAAAYVLDTQLRTHLVPYTDVVSLSSKSFHYDWWERRAFYRRKKPLPEKPGSFQVFLKGYKDANIFLKEHPWPDQHNSGFRTDAAPRRKKRRWAEECRPSGPVSDNEDEGSRADSRAQTEERREFWTDGLQQSFREQLEKLVILDYIMRNTDRGLDNWMIKIDKRTQQASIVAEPPHMNGDNEEGTQPSSYTKQSMEEQEPYRRQEPMRATSRSATPQTEATPMVSIGAIDNSLSWPWKHPDAWRSYPFGWLFLPVSLIGQPFSDATRRHFLPLLTSKQWWSDTQLALRRCFSQDSDFKERMFAKQMAVMKGQAWNVVETLKTMDHGPLELTRRARVCVWDDLVDIPIAVPLRAASAEMKRKQQKVQPQQQPSRQRPALQHEEMDITALSTSTPRKPQPDLVMTSPPLDQANENPFNLSRHGSTMDVRESTDSTRNTIQPASWTGRMINDRPADLWSSRPAHRTRLSYDASRRNRTENEDRRRRFSLSSRRGVGMLGEEDEGDLGYAANEDLDGNTKKVIVERLEMVKGRNPVFTWC
ncbi:hypothetical protein M011DRAFT_525946 [Sporormia fimetaria CBS 119925]|uniref:1-phosphatidylinositol 4-kinase n=1 Tax=Sporormia fimetaria CBS 119925 TaxID=1340428 RepID=A0A6A6VF67_9PLEO|nr:hypothetical protein M011DRAFT_525946 [Sporormia fimetaria CBS 119925]